MLYPVTSGFVQTNPAIIQEVQFHIMSRKP